jgi:hypothetical protein
MIDFPASPTTGQQFTAAGVTWTWDGIKWQASGLGTNYLPLSGGTMAGPLTLAGDPTLPLHPVTKQMFDRQSGFTHDNRVINGDMWNDQRNAGASGTAINVYTIDRWKYSCNVAGLGNWQRSAVVSVQPGGFPLNLAFASTTAHVSAASDICQWLQPIEADFVSDFMWGTANAQPVTLSFWAAASIAGTFGGAITNDIGTRSYPFTYTLAANTWTKIVVTIPGDTAGAWVMAGTGIGVQVHFDLGSGATYRGPAGAWATANYAGATGAVSVVGTNGATFNLTGVKLETGSVATPFTRLSTARKMADCQRYYQVLDNIITNGYGATGAAIYASFPFPTRMRTQPTGVITAPTYNNAQSLSINASQASSVMTLANIVGTGPGWAIGTISLNAEL